MGNSQSEYMTTAEATMRLGITANTLREWAKRGKVEYIRTDGNQRRYSRVSVSALCESESLTIGYTLFRSWMTAEERTEAARPLVSLSQSRTITLYSDTGSPVDMSRASLVKIMKLARSRKVILFVVNADDLAVVGFEFLKSYLALNGGSVMCLSKKESSEPEVTFTINEVYPRL